MPFAPPAEVPETTFVEGSGTAFNTIPPTDARFFETVHALLQDEPADAGDLEIVGHLGELGIVKGKPFAPDERMRRILDEAATVGNATSRALMFDARGEEDVFWYPDSAWTNLLFQGGYQFDRPIPQVTPEGIKPYPPTGTRKHDLRTLFFYGYTGITPAMAMRLTGIGSPVPRRLHGLQQGLPRRGQVVHGDVAAGHPPGPVLVAHAVRQPDPLDADHPAALPPRRQPGLPVAGRGGQPGRLDHHPRRPRAARRRPRRQLDPDRSRTRGSSPSSACTAHCSRSSTSPGASASSNPPRRSSHDRLGHPDRTRRAQLVLDA